jgi:RNA polymerase sigma factor (sigma-70 family)
MTLSPHDHSTFTDKALLQDFVATRSADAFRTLVDRHLPAILAAARRILGGNRAPLAHHAEDVAQSVFILLARNASHIRAGTPLIGWLYKVTHHACANLKKMERRRRQREILAMRHLQTVPPTVSPAEALLDPALLTLSAHERDALLLRYAQDQSLAAIAQLTRVPPETAKKRLHRALQKLRRYFAAHGLLSAAPLALQTLTSTRVESLAHLSHQITTAALAPASATAQSLLIVKGVTYMITTAKAVKISALVVILILCFVGGIVLFRPAPPTPKPGTGGPSPAVNQVEPQVRFTVKNADGQSPANITALLFHYNPITYQQETVMEFHGTGFLAAEIPTRYFLRNGGSWMIAFADNGGLAYYRMPDTEPTDPINLTLSRPARLKGKVLDPAGKPISGALVWVFSVWPHGDKPPADAQPVTLQKAGVIMSMPPQAESWSGLLQQPHPALSATSSADGAFEIPHLVEGATVEVFCYAAGYAQLRQKLEISNPNATLTLKDPEAIIKGRVVDAAGAPMKNLFVAAQGPMGAWQTAPTAADGAFTLRYLPAGVYNLFPGLDPNEETSIAVGSFTASAGLTVNAPDIRVLPGTLIEGLVVDAATGLPVQPGASSDIGFYGPARPRSGGGAVQSAQIGPDGTFHIRLPPGENFPYLRSQDWTGMADFKPLVIAPNQEKASLTIRVQRAPPGQNTVLIIR